MPFAGGEETSEARCGTVVGAALGLAWEECDEELKRCQMDEADNGRYGGFLQGVFSSPAEVGAMKPLEALGEARCRGAAIFGTVTLSSIW